MMEGSLAAFALTTGKIRGEAKKMHTAEKKESALTIP
jgi:hypothetical protein